MHFFWTEKKWVVMQQLGYGNSIVKKMYGVFRFELYHVNAYTEDTPYLIEKCFILIKT